jgi:hypothetical protein
MTYTYVTIKNKAISNYTGQLCSSEITLFLAMTASFAFNNS